MSRSSLSLALCSFTLLACPSKGPNNNNGTTTGPSGATGTTSETGNVIGDGGQAVLAVTPSTVVADGIALATITVTVKDGSGNAVGGVPVTVAATGAGNTLSASPATDATGVTTVTLASTVAEVKTITATAGGVALLSSVSVTFVAGPVAKLTWTVQPPAQVGAGAAIAPALTVKLFDAHDNPSTGTDAVTAALGGGTGGATLSGTRTVNAVMGVATFADLSVDAIGGGYWLTASVGTAMATSNMFSVVIGPPSASASTIS
jgi:hypothetical protein